MPNPIKHRDSSRAVRHQTEDSGEVSHDSAIELRRRRRSWFQDLLELHRGIPIRVARANHQGEPKEWFDLERYRLHDLRQVLEFEVAFDVGDTTDFETALQHSWALWDLLEQTEGGPFQDHTFYGALSGGKGVHTHVFLDNQVLMDQMEKAHRNGTLYSNGELNDSVRKGLIREFDKREWFKKAILGLWRDELGEDPDVDMTLLAPKKLQLVRSFGALKADRKVLVATMEERVVDPTMDRRSCYDAAGDRIPETVSVIPQPVGVRHAVVRSAVGGPCPQNSNCLRYGGWCTSCPVQR